MWDAGVLIAGLLQQSGLGSIDIIDTWDQGTLAATLARKHRSQSESDDRPALVSIDDENNDEYNIWGLYYQNYKSCPRNTMVLQKFAHPNILSSDETRFIVGASGEQQAYLSFSLPKNKIAMSLADYLADIYSGTANISVSSSDDKRMLADLACAMLHSFQQRRPMSVDPANVLVIMDVKGELCTYHNIQVVPHCRETSEIYFVQHSELPWPQRSAVEFVNVAFRLMAKLVNMKRKPNARIGQAAADEYMARLLLPTHEQARLPVPENAEQIQQLAALCKTRLGCYPDDLIHAHIPEQADVVFRKLVHYLQPSIGSHIPPPPDPTAPGRDPLLETK
jgi:hypothetical protein